MKLRVLNSSKNSKLGNGVSVSYGTKQFCVSCPLHNAGCYAETGHLGVLAKKLESAKVGLGNVIDYTQYDTWLSLQPAYRLLNDNIVPSLHRFFVDGNPPLCSDGTLDTSILSLWFSSSTGESIFYANAVFSAEKTKYLQSFQNKNGISTTINYSTHSVREALAVVRSGGCATIAAAMENGLTVVEGVRFVACPAESTGGAVTCSSCGNGKPLCSRKRDYVIVFRPHGTKKGSIKTDLDFFKTQLESLNQFTSKLSGGEFYTLHYKKGMELLKLSVKFYGINQHGNILIKVFSGSRFGQWRTLRPSQIVLIKQKSEIFYSVNKEG